MFFPLSRAIAITPVNDAPTLTGTIAASALKPITGASYTFAANELNFDDAKDISNGVGSFTAGIDEYTVTLNVTEAVKNAKAGQVQYRTDKSGIVHATIGRASFEVDALRTNLAALVEALVKAKPASSKGVYLKKIAVSSTMGIGVRVDQLSLSEQA